MPFSYYKLSPIVNVEELWSGWYRKQITSVYKLDWPRVTSRCEREELRGRKGKRRGEGGGRERERNLEREEERNLFLQVHQSYQIRTSLLPSHLTLIIC